MYHIDDPNPSKITTTKLLRFRNNRQKQNPRLPLLKIDFKPIRLRAQIKLTLLFKCTYFQKRLPMVNFHYSFDNNEIAFVIMNSFHLALETDK